MSEHLNEAAQKALSLSDADRIHFIRSPRWIGYTLARTVLEKLEDLLSHPKMHRMPNLLIVGETNNGKTMLANRFRSRHLAHDNPHGDGIIIPILLVQAPALPDEGRFYSTILDKLCAPYRSHDRPEKRLTQIITLFKRLRVQMLAIDEIHNIIAGPMNRQRQFLNAIKYLGNELQIPIVAIGTKEAFNALQTDPQLSNRFEPATLPRWEINEEYLRLLMSFEQMIPLKKPSFLVETSLALKLLSMSEGKIGELAMLLERASVAAVKKKEEAITVRLLDSINWIAPSDRKWQAVKT